ncbi:MAG: 5-formyltetrahydrofolate cyclo-ligase [Flavobacteriaceae bacterium]
MEKKYLRELYKAKRAALSKEELDTLSLAIANQALHAPIWDKTYYHIFFPIAHKKEVNTEFILHILQGRDKSIVVPKAHFNTGEMTSILLQENTLLKTSPYGIPEPVEGIEIAPQQLDVLFIPLLAYDKNGNRMGYGKGFYDRFLKKCKKECRFVGLSFFEPEEAIEIDAHDIPIHTCITPYKIYNFL